MTERKRVMTDYRNDTEERELLEERRKLSLERIQQIPEEKSVPVTYREYFAEDLRRGCHDGHEAIQKCNDEKHQKQTGGFGYEKRFYGAKTADGLQRVRRCADYGRLQTSF